ncbi:MAG: TRAP transporter small permease [Bacteroidales bacterium]|nr:MAG: TRAP transporter small permease [Bacteroidales bacterium]
MIVRKYVDKILEILVITIMSVLVIDVLWQVASRYLLRNPSSFTDELAGFLLIWVGLFGAAYGTGAGLHLAIDLLPSRLPPDKRKYLELAINILIGLFSLTVMVVGGTWLVYTRFYLGQITAALQMPLGYVYLVIPLSGVFIIYYCISNTIIAFKTYQNMK